MCRGSNKFDVKSPQVEETITANLEFPVKVIEKSVETRRRFYDYFYAKGSFPSIFDN